MSLLMAKKGSLSIIGAACTRPPPVSSSSSRSSETLMSMPSSLA